MTDTPLLSAAIVPAKNRPLGCLSCKLYQYAPGFTKQDREQYQAKLDPERKNKKRVSHCMSSGSLEPAEVMVLLDSPSGPEDESGEAFSGGNARMIRRNAKECGIDISQWHWEYLIRCFPGAEKSDMRTVTYCSGFLSKVIQAVKPKVIIAFGQLPLAALLGKPDAVINQYICNPQKATVAGHDCIVYPMQAPWFITRNDYMSAKYLEHFDSLAKFLSGDAQDAVKVDRSKYGIIDDPDEAIRVCERMLAKAREGVIIDADTETSGLNPFNKNQRLSVVSLSCSTKRGYAIMYDHDEVPWSPQDRKRVKKALKALLTDPAVQLRWHNGKFDVQWIRAKLGFWPRDQVEDTMLSHYAVDENELHGLKALALQFTDMGDYDAELDRVLDAQTFPDAPRYDLVPVDIIGKYAAMDSVATRKLAKVFRTMAAEQGPLVEALSYRMMPALSVVLADMEYNGVAIDTEITKKVIIPSLTDMAKKSWDEITNDPVVRRFCRDKENEHRAKMKRPAPIEVKRYFKFSLGSPKQLQELLYGESYFAADAQVFTDKGSPSTDKEALTDMANAGVDIAKKIMEYRLDDKMVNSFGQPLLDRVAAQADGHNFIHGSFSIIGTRTGRLSSKEPNLQQIPGKSGGVIKRMFVSRYGDEGVFIQIDFSQIELRVLAAMSGDPTMINVYTTGGDIHTTNACMVFGMTEEEMLALPKDEQKKRRTVAKRLGFGICYGIGGPGIQSTLKSDGVIVDEDTAQGYLDTFLEKYPKVAKFIEKSHDLTEELRHALSAFGRRRRLPSVASGAKDVKARALRQAGNHVIQCLHPDTLVVTDCGLLPLTECDGKRVWDGESWSVAHLHGPRTKDEYVVKTYGGGEVRCSGDHLFESTRGVWVKAKDLEPGMDLVGWAALSDGGEPPRIPTDAEFTQLSSRGSPGPQKYHLVPFNEDDVYEVLWLFGLIVGDGSYCHGRTRGGTLVVRYREVDIKQRVEAAMSKLIGTAAPCNLKMFRGQPSYYVYYIPRCVLSLMSWYGFTMVSAADKDLPAWIYTSNRKARASLVAGVFDADSGLIGKLPGSFALALNVVSRRLSEQCAYVLRTLGVGAHVRDYANGVYKRVFRCLISANQVGAYRREVGHTESPKRHLTELLAAHNDLSYDSDKFNGLTADRVRSVTKTGARYAMYDLEVDSPRHAFVAGGVMVHNSTAGDLTNTALVLFNQEMRLRRGENPDMILPTVTRREFPVDERWNRVHPILQVHDMLGLDCHRDIAGEAMERLHWTMENVVDLAPLVWGDEIIPGLKKLKRVPIIAEPEVGPNWRDAYKVKTAADIDKAMFVACAKRDLLDKDINFKWGPEHEAKALEDYEKSKK